MKRRMVHKAVAIVLMLIALAVLVALTWKLVLFGLCVIGIVAAVLVGGWLMIRTAKGTSTPEP